jgi:hypothetical protein
MGQPKLDLIPGFEGGNHHHPSLGPSGADDSPTNPLSPHPPKQQHGRSDSAAADPKPRDRVGMDLRSLVLGSKGGQDAVACPLQCDLQERSVSPYIVRKGLHEYLDHS